MYLNFICNCRAGIGLLHEEYCSQTGWSNDHFLHWWFWHNKGMSYDHISLLWLYMHYVYSISKSTRITLWHVWKGSYIICLIDIFNLLLDMENTTWVCLCQHFLLYIVLSSIWLVINDCLEKFHMTCIMMFISAFLIDDITRIKDYKIQWKKTSNNLNKFSFNLKRHSMLWISFEKP